jgi:hypothetical protein
MKVTDFDKIKGRKIIEKSGKDVGICKITKKSR